MPHDLTRVSATVKYVSVYRCVSCGVRQSGNTVVDRIDVSSSTELKDAIDAAQQSAHHMPTGWSNHLDGFRCGECT